MKKKLHSQSRNLKDDLDSQLQKFKENQNSIYLFIIYYGTEVDMVQRQNSTTAEEVARFQRLFPNPSWLMSGRTSGHQNLVSIFPGIDNCLKAKR